jgi:hypothetical protein
MSYGIIFGGQIHLIAFIYLNYKKGKSELLPIPKVETLIGIILRN